MKRDTLPRDASLNATPPTPLKGGVGGVSRRYGPIPGRSATPCDTSATPGVALLFILMSLVLIAVLVADELDLIIR